MYELFRTRSLLYFIWGIWDFTKGKGCTNYVVTEKKSLILSTTSWHVAETRLLLAIHILPSIIYHHSFFYLSMSFYLFKFSFPSLFGKDYYYFTNCDYCDWFCHTSTCVTSFLEPRPPPSPSHPSRLSQSTGFGFPASYIKHALAIYFIYSNIYVSRLYAIFSFCDE